MGVAKPQRRSGDPRLKLIEERVKPLIRAATTTASQSNKQIQF